MKRSKNQKSKKDQGNRRAHMDKKRGDRHKQLRNEAKWRNHYEVFDDMLKTKCLKLEDIDGDGNCLFRAVSDQLFGNQNRHVDLRLRCAEFMGAEKDRLQHFLDVDDDMKFDDYVEWIAVNGNWAGYFEIYCMCQLFKINFRLVLKDGSLIPMQHFEMARSLVLAFHEDEANGIPEHYSSVRYINDDRKIGLCAQLDLRLLEGLKTPKENEFKIVIPESDEDESKLSKRKSKKESKKDLKKLKNKENPKCSNQKAEKEKIVEEKTEERLEDFNTEYIDISDDELPIRLIELGF